MYRRVAGGGTYIDGFAGTGSVQVDGKTRPGSARIAISSQAFRHLFFFEQEEQVPVLERTLQRCFSPRELQPCTVVPGDVNSCLPALLATGQIPRGKPCFALFDPDSTQLAWSTVEAIARYKDTGPGSLKIELLILLNTYQALVRLMPTTLPPGYEIGPWAATLDRVMGSRDAWWDLLEEHGRAQRLAVRYAQRLMDLLAYGLAKPYLIRDPKSGRPQYHMIHASDHPAAFRLMRWAEVQTMPGLYPTPRLFGMDV